MGPTKYIYSILKFFPVHHVCCCNYRTFAKVGENEGILAMASFNTETEIHICCEKKPNVMSEAELTSRSGVLTSRGSSTSKDFLHSSVGCCGLSIRALTW